MTISLGMVLGGDGGREGGHVEGGHEVEDRDLVGGVEVERVVQGESDRVGVEGAVRVGVVRGEWRASQARDELLQEAFTLRRGDGAAHE